MADESALAVARQAWDRWVAADLEGFLALWAADGVWTMQGHSQISGTWQGPDEIAKVAQTAFEVSGGTLKARPIELAAAGADSVLAIFTSRHLGPTQRSIRMPSSVSWCGTARSHRFTTCSPTLTR